MGSNLEQTRVCIGTASSALAKERHVGQRNLEDARGAGSSRRDWRRIGVAGWPPTAAAAGSSGGTCSSGSLGWASRSSTGTHQSTCRVSSSIVAFCIGLIVRVQLPIRTLAWLAWRPWDAHKGLVQRQIMANGILERAREEEPTMSRR